MQKEFLDQLEIHDITRSAAQSTKFMLTSDGIHDHLTLDEMEAFLVEASSESALVKLADLAVKKGSEDDLTVMVIER